MYCCINICMHQTMIFTGAYYQFESDITSVNYNETYIHKVNVIQNCKPPLLGTGH